MSLNLSLKDKPGNYLSKNPKRKSFNLSKYLITLKFVKFTRT
jgi:hypothetical protein